MIKECRGVNRESLNTECGMDVLDLFRAVHSRRRGAPPFNWSARFSEFVTLGVSSLGGELDFVWLIIIVRHKYGH